MASVRIATALAVVLAAPNLIFDEVTASDVFSEAYKYTGEGRHLQTCTNSDDALDPTPPNRRDNVAFTSRRDAARRERDGTGTVCQINNGDPDLAGMFHKSLPHDDLGQVDAADFAILEDCILNGDFSICEGVPLGNSEGDPVNRLVNPTAAFAIDISGPAFSATTIPPVPTLSSPELAAQLAEVYWMALARDVPFMQYGTDEITTTAAANLAGMEGFPNLDAISIGSDGTVDPFSQLFRATFVGVETGPFISQLLVNSFTIDSITVEPKQETFAPGVNYLVDFDEWLNIQNGGPPVGPEELDDVRRFVRNARDLARVSFTDNINTEAYRGALILLELDAFNRAGVNGPFIDSDRQSGFVNFGTSHYFRLIGAAELAQRASWYQKWQVHRFARPEALGGTLHLTIKGELDAAFDISLLENDELLKRVAEINAAQNPNAEAIQVGSPTHPSYPSGHATQNGAFATVLKALIGLDRGGECFPNPVFPDDDGLELIDFEGSCLTYEGEINKLAVNVAFGRQMLGIHYRFDGIQGLILGETITVRTLHQELMTFAEESTFEFRLFTGEVIKLFQDGTFSIDDFVCPGLVYTGVADCV
ncbi:unnamed protein product [Ascophyllum nodosum]